MTLGNRATTSAFALLVTAACANVGRSGTASAGVQPVIDRGCLNAPWRAPGVDERVCTIVLGMTEDSLIAIMSRAGVSMEERRGERYVITPSVESRYTFRFTSEERRAPRILGQVSHVWTVHTLAALNGLRDTLERFVLARHAPRTLCYVGVRDAPRDQTATFRAKDAHDGTNAISVTSAIRRDSASVLRLRLLLTVNREDPYDGPPIELDEQSCVLTLEDSLNIAGTGGRQGQ